MKAKIPNAIVQLTQRMLMLKAMQEDVANDEAITERGNMILGLLYDKGKLSVSEIADADPNVGYSTISTDVTKLWRDKQMLTKTIDPENQRVTMVELTDKGRKAVERVRNQRNERFEKLYKAMDLTDEEAKVFLGVLNRTINYFDGVLGLNGHKSPSDK